MAGIRLLFYSHDTFGLGHFRRSLTIASHLRRHLPISFNRVRRLREKLIKAVAKSYDPHMLIVDNVPRGVDGELLPTLEFLHAYRPHTKIVLTLRDILDEPARIVPLWREW